MTLCALTDCINIPECLTTLQIGTIANVSTAVKVRIENLSSNYLSIIDATSDIDGIVTIPMDEPSKAFWNTTGYYRISVYLPTDLNNPIAIVVDTVSTFYLAFGVDRINSNISINTWTLKLKNDC